MKTLFAFIMVLFGFSVSAFAGTESFRQTCFVRYEDRYRIQADCRTSYGNYVYNDYRKSFCRGDLANIEGTMRCMGGGNGGYNPLPQGSYQLTCASCSADGNVLSCQCLDMQNRYRYTTLNYRWCQTEIANLNGRLSCN